MPLVPRTKPARVQAILSAGGNYRAGVDLAPFIRTASRTITRVAACAVAKGISLDAETLEDIEAWYAAHVYTRSDPTYSSKSTLSASGSYTRDGSEFLNQAIALDESGCLADIVNSVKQRIAGGVCLRTPPSSQTDYVDAD